MPVCRAKDGTAFAVPAEKKPTSSAQNAPAHLELPRTIFFMISLSKRDTRNLLTAGIERSRFVAARFDVDQTSLAAARASEISHGLRCRADPDRRRREADDAREELAEILLVPIALERIGVFPERAVDRRPVREGEQFLGEREHVLFFLAHVVPVSLNEPVHLPRELWKFLVPALFVPHQVLLDAAQRRLTLGVLPLQLGDQRIGLCAAPAQGVEEKPVFLRVVLPLGEDIEVVQHRAGDLGIDLRLALADLPHQMLHAVQYRGDGAMLGSNDVQGFRHSALLFAGISMLLAGTSVL